MRALRLRDVTLKVGLRTTAIYEAVKRGEFPRPVKLGPKAKGWLEHELDAWLEKLRDERDGVKPVETAPDPTGDAEADEVAA